MQERAPAQRGPVIDPVEPHAYVEGVRIQRGSDGRVFRQCSVCAHIANSLPHRGFRQKRLTAKELRQGGEYHPFRPGGVDVVFTNGVHRRACADCGLESRAAQHLAQHPYSEAASSTIRTSRAVVTAPTGAARGEGPSVAPSTDDRPAAPAVAAPEAARIIETPAEFVVLA